MATSTFDQLPVRISLNGSEIVPIDTPVGDGTYVTERTTAGQLAAQPVADAPYVVAFPVAYFPASRTLAATSGQTTLTDGGAGANLSIGLAAASVTPGTYGSTSAIAQFTVDQQGRLQAASNVDISGTYQPIAANLTSWAAIPRASGFDAFAATPSSANLRALVTDESGTGELLFQNGALGTPTSGTATNLTGLPVSTGIAGLATNMAAFLAGGTSAQLAATVTDETGTGSLVFATSPTVALGTASTAVTQTPADNSTKIATTAYVQAAIFATTTLPASKYATTAALPSATYANGASGVGATLTGVGLGAVVIDGVTPAVNDIVLIKNQASTFQNGIYSVTTVGSVGAAFVLTRATYYNIAADINLGDTTFVVAGSTQTATSWSQNGTENPVIGTNPIGFAQTAGLGSYTAGNGLTLSGAQFAIDTSITVDLSTAQTLTNKSLTSPTLTGTVSVPNSSFSLAKLANGTALSVPGVAGNAGAAYADITAGTDGFILRRSGTTLGFGTILSTSISDFSTAGNALIAAQVGVSVQAYDAQLSSLIRQNSQSAAYTLVLADSGKQIYHPSADTTARIWTIPANASVAFAIGTAITFVNDTSAGVITIAITTDSMKLAGVGTTGSRTLAANGIATALKITATSWIISGTGLT